jgi:hypothetical protein
MFEFEVPVARDRDLCVLPRQWAMFSAHGHVLISIARDPDTDVAQIAERLRMSQIGVRRVISDLVAAGLIGQVRIGRQNRFVITCTDPMLADLSSPRSVGAVTRLYGRTA